MLQITSPKEVTFHLPAGNYKAKIIEVKPFVKQTSKGPQDWVRFLYEVSIPSMSHLICMAGRNLHCSLKPGSDLRNFVGTLLGGRFFLDRSGEKLDLESLKDRDI